MSEMRNLLNKLDNIVESSKELLTKYADKADAEGKKHADDAQTSLAKGDDKGFKAALNKAGNRENGSWLAREKVDGKSAKVKAT